MAEELEIKLTLLHADLKRASAWLLEQSQASRGVAKTLVNRYYDTPGAELNKKRTALRVRQAGERPGEALVRAVETLPPMGDGDRVWAAGEAASMQAIRKHLFDARGLSRRQATVRGYWKPARR